MIFNRQLLLKFPNLQVSSPYQTFPKSLSVTRRPSLCHSQGLEDANEIVVHKIDCHHVRVRSVSSTPSKRTALQRNSRLASKLWRAGTVHNGSVGQLWPFPRARHAAVVFYAMAMVSPHWLNSCSST